MISLESPAQSPDWPLLCWSCELTCQSSLKRRLCLPHCNKGPFSLPGPTAPLTLFTRLLRDVTIPRLRCHCAPLHILVPAHWAHLSQQASQNHYLLTWNLYISPLRMLLSTVPPKMYMASEMTAAAWKSLPLGS